jgi:predicted site-specific integrase-resolvase
VGAGEKLLSQRAARELLGGVSDMTFHRWRQKGILPAPVVINGRNYWPEHVVARLASEGSKEVAE